MVKLSKEMKEAIKNENNSKGFGISCSCRAADKPGGLGCFINEESKTIKRADRTIQI